jgi:DnaJ domain
MSSISPPAVEAPANWPKDELTVEVATTRPAVEDLIVPDYYEALRISPTADEDTIERVYATLSSRFQPDNPITGHRETFLRIQEAYETLSNPAKRAQYNVLRQRLLSSTRFRLSGREFFDGVRGEQNRRLAVLCLLYRQRISNHESPGLTLLDLEKLTGCTREELGSSLWYLAEKKWALIGDTTQFSITADGFDTVESKLESRMEFLALATVRYYPGPIEAAIGTGHSAAIVTSEKQVGWRRREAPSFRSSRPPVRYDRPRTFRSGGEHGRRTRHHPYRD